MFVDAVACFVTPDRGPWGFYCPASVYAIVLRPLDDLSVTQVGSSGWILQKDT